MRDFVVPRTDTKVMGEVRLEYAFQLTAHYDPPKVSQTPKGAFRYQDIVSGEVRGAHLNATVYPDSGGQYDTVRSDRIRDVDAHFMLKAENGEFIFEHGPRGEKVAVGIVGGGEITASPDLTITQTDI